VRGLFFRNTGSLDNLKVEELPMPVPKAGEVLVKVHAAAINPSDAKNVLGKMPDTKTPRVPGRDFAGRVVSGGSLGEARRSSEPEGISVLAGMAAMPNLWPFPWRD